jgi:hypothetical protein
MLISRASEQHPKSNDTAKLKNNQQTITTYRQKGSADGSLTLPQRSRARQRNKPPVIKQNKNQTPNQDSWWAMELILALEDNIQTQTAIPH